MNKKYLSNIRLITEQLMIRNLYVKKGKNDNKIFNLICKSFFHLV